MKKDNSKRPSKRESVYVVSLVMFLERSVGELIRNDKTGGSDYYMGQVNTYQEVIEHIRKTFY